jgi:hypothetical protein
MVIPPLLAALRCHQLGLDTRFILSFLSFAGKKIFPEIEYV